MPTTPPVRNAIFIARWETSVRSFSGSPDSGVAALAAAATRTLLRTASHIPI